MRTVKAISLFIMFFGTILHVQGIVNIDPLYTDAKYETLSHLTTLTNIPRAAYKLKKAASPFWIIELNIQEETREVPLLMHFYSNKSWFANSDSPNIEKYDCDASTSCIVYDSENTQTLDYLTFSVRGKRGTLRAYPNSYTIPFDAYQTDETNRVLPSPPLKIYGGIGFGLSYSSDYTSFLQSFQNLDKKVAGLYLSLNNFEVTSELIVGDYNPNFFNPKEKKINLSVTDAYTWTIEFNSLNDSNTLDYSISGKFTFDPNSNFIGVPSSLYNTFISNLTSKLSQSCKYVTPNYVCTCTDKSDFPTLNFVVINQTLAIPPEIYVSKTDQCTLLFTANNESGVISDQFANNWIFGSPVMTYYYTILNFTGSPTSITLVKAEVFESNTKWYLILGIITAVVLMAGLIACLSILRSKKTEQMSEPLIRNELEDKKQMEEADEEERKEPN